MFSLLCPVNSTKNRIVGRETVCNNCDSSDSHLNVCWGLFWAQKYCISQNTLVLNAINNAQKTYAKIIQISWKWITLRMCVGTATVVSDYYSDFQWGKKQVKWDFVLIEESSKQFNLLHKPFVCLQNFYAIKRFDKRMKWEVLIELCASVFFDVKIRSCFMFCWPSSL